MFDQLADLDPEQKRVVLARLQGLPPEQVNQLLATLRGEAVARCAKDGLFWLRFVKTRDEADPDSPVKAFPSGLEYVREVWRLLVERQRVVIAKSRQMMISWILCAFCCYVARTRPNSLVIFQCQKYEDACAMVSVAGGQGAQYLGRCQFIERNLPSWLRVVDPRTGEAEGSLSYPNGSMILALAGGANQIRGKTATLIVEDEFAFQPEAKGVFTAVAPLIQKGTKFIGVSTPNGAEGNMFYHLFHGLQMDQAA